VVSAQFALVFASFLHWDMNVLRSLPCSDLPSASFEHSNEAAERVDAGFFSAGAAVVAAGAAGAGVCANAEPTSSSDAMAVTAARVERLIMALPHVEERRDHRVAMLNGR
jgi:hypothetical protein